MYPRKTGSGTDPIFLRATLLPALLLLLGSRDGFAEDLPDPGRRLSTEEQKADPEKRKVPPPTGLPGASKRPYDARACQNARIYYQVSCGAPDSQRSYGRSCAEAYALYRENCP